MSPTWLALLHTTRQHERFPKTVLAIALLTCALAAQATWTAPTKWSAVLPDGWRVLTEDDLAPLAVQTQLAQLKPALGGRAVTPKWRGCTYEVWRRMLVRTDGVLVTDNAQDGTFVRVFERDKGFNAPVLLASPALQVFRLEEGERVLTLAVHEASARTNDLKPRVDALLARFEASVPTQGGGDGGGGSGFWWLAALPFLLVLGMIYRHGRR